MSAIAWIVIIALGVALGILLAGYVGSELAFNALENALEEFEEFE